MVAHLSKAGVSNFFQSRAKFAVPNVSRAKDLVLVWQKVLKTKKKKVFTQIGSVSSVQSEVKTEKKKSSVRQFRWMLWCSPKCKHKTN